MIILPSVPDPERASKNVESFLSENPADSDRFLSSLPQVSMLFSSSQFLANHCIRNPGVLFDALDRLDTPLEPKPLREELRELFAAHDTVELGMKAVRDFKRRKLLLITLRDVLKRTGLQETVADLSSLADAILSESLGFVESFLMRRFGAPENNPLAVISLGKLGAQELNYSSDVDIVFVYRDEGETSGVSTLQGVTRNRISTFEYYTKLVEEYNRFLSTNTGDGFACRVDLRLRPQGQRGNLAMCIRGYEEYYESWGQLWERAALLRARPAAGDAALGDEFLEMIRPFVYRKYLDFQAIDEIRRMKAQVEQIKPGTQSRDIKRGYGGIREIEFFIQVFQLLYGGREPLLRERGTLLALHRLSQKGYIGYDDLRYLSDNYVFLRTLEHRLQQVNDIQTHALPSGEGELDVLGRKMGFENAAAFLAGLDARRRKVRTIYDSLLGVRDRIAGESDSPGGGAHSEGLMGNAFWDMESPVEDLISEELAKTKVRDAGRAIRHLVKIRNTIYTFQTLRGRRLLEDIIPKFVNEVLKEDDPDLALLHLVDFSALMAAKESYLDAIAQRNEIISAFSFIFSHSEYLSRILMSNPEYIESLVEGEARKKTLRGLKGELKLLIESRGESTAVRLFRRLEEIRLGMLFLDRDIDVSELTNSLSKVAESVLLAMLHSSYPGLTRGTRRTPLAVIGFGKFGGREITFNSDLDVVFVTPHEPGDNDIKAAERLLKVSMSYTKDGAAYKIDTRLRPEGNKGPLVSSSKGLSEYYLKHAQAWELQALLKARPISADAGFSRAFMEMRKSVLMERGSELAISGIKKMRERIQRELSKDRLKDSKKLSLPFDVKLGAGGLEELEFLVQYLQIKYAETDSRLLVQGTLAALGRLGKAGILKAGEAETLKDVYSFFRSIETILRLRNEPLLKEDGNTLQSMSNIIGVDIQGFLQRLSEGRRRVSGFWDRLNF